MSNNIDIFNLDKPSLDDTIIEAKRQTQICNACRYCEGYCAVFPALHKLSDAKDNDMIALANICHNCRGCYYACQYAEPHEFNVNIPNIMAQLQYHSWQKYSSLGRISALFHKNIWAYIGLSVIFTIIFAMLAINMMPENKIMNNFYDYLSHDVLISIFIPLFILPYIDLGVSLNRFWHDIGGGNITLNALIDTMRDVGKMKNLSGGGVDGDRQGCNYENQDEFSHKRRYAHQILLYGFLLCFLSTSSATILHYVFNYPAPYPLFSLPKLLGVPGGVMMVIGAAWLLYLKSKSDKHLSAKQNFYGEIGFTLLLLFVALTGLLLYAFNNHNQLLPIFLYSHLALVAVLFTITPYSKMAHGFYRALALLHSKVKA